MWSVSVGMERWCGAVGDLVQSESAQKGFVRTQYRRCLENFKIIKRGHLLMDVSVGVRVREVLIS